MKKFLLILLIIIILLWGWFSYLYFNPQLPLSQKVLSIVGIKTAPGKVAQIANSASVFCEQNSGTVEVIQVYGGQFGLCHFSNGNICEEQAYMKGYCLNTGHLGILNSSSYFIAKDEYNLDTAYFLQINNLQKKIEWADVATFIILSDIYAKDKNNVYYGINILSWADPITFIVTTSGDQIIGKDKNDIYMNWINSQEYQQLQDEKAQYPTEEERKQFTEDRMLIEKYYKAINNKDFETAFSLIINSKTTLDQLKSKYQNVDKMIIYDIWDSTKWPERTYTFYIYYTEKNSTESTTYEVTKRIIDGKLENISSKVRPTAVPEEFSLNDSKYQIFYLTSSNMLDYFVDFTAPTGKEFDGIISSSDPDCTLNTQDPNISQNKKYQEKLIYFRNLFTKYTNSDQMKVYLIKDKTLLYWKSKDSGLVEEAGEWMRIFIMPNKAGYTNKDTFIADFGEHCWISGMFPFAISQKYLVFIDSCYCWVACPLWCETISEKIGNVLQLK